MSRFFSSVAFKLANSSASRLDVIRADVLEGLQYIGSHSGQDKPLRAALDSLKASAPVGKSGKITPHASNVLANLGTAMTAGKLAFSRLQKANRLDEQAQADYAAECAHIIDEFMSKCFPVREAKPKVAKTNLDRVQGDYEALSETERKEWLLSLPEVQALLAAHVVAPAPAKGRKASPLQVAA